MQCIGIYLNPNKNNVLPVIHTAVKYLQSRGIKVLIPEDWAAAMLLPELAADREAMKRRITLALTFGGDGTLLNVAKEVAQTGIPVCGVNLGHLGFLTQIEVSDLERGLERLITGDYFTEQRLMLDPVIVRNGEDLPLQPALNDVVITKGGFARIIRLHLYVSGQLTESYSADGLIIATSTGSTGYSLSAGGPIISPHVKVTVVTPICPHTLNSRSIVISEEEEIAITVQSAHDDIALTVDGQKAYHLFTDDKVFVRRSSLQALLVRFPDRGFYETLHSKLKREA